MNVTDRKLSEELFKLSGWETFNVLCQSGSYREGYGEDSDEGWFSYDPNEAVAHHQNIYQTYQAYDLGYLLRKLNEARITRRIPMRLTMDANSVGYSFGYEEYLRTTHEERPEDAAAMLAIELFKKRLLTHD